MTKQTSITPASVSTRSLKAKVGKAKAANVALDRDKRTARILTALPVYIAVASGRIGEGQPWETQTKFAADLGTSKSNVTGLVRIGHALALGLDPMSGYDASTGKAEPGSDADLWSVLSAKANNSPTLRAVLDNGKAMLPQVRKAIIVAKSEKTGRKVNPNPGQGDSGTPGDGGDENGQAGQHKAPTASEVLDSLRVMFSGDLADEKTAAKVCKAAHDVLAVAMTALGADTFPTAERRHTRILNSEIARRAGATPATVADMVKATESTGTRIAS